MSKAVVAIEVAGALAAVALGYYAVKNAGKIGGALGSAVGNLVKGVATGAGLDKLAGAINPTNPSNVFSTGANAAVQAVTGNDNTSVGSTFADFFPSSAEQKVNQMLARDPAQRAVLPSLASDFPASPPDAILGGAPLTAEQQVEVGMIFGGGA